MYLFSKKQHKNIPHNHATRISLSRGNIGRFSTTQKKYAPRSPQSKIPPYPIKKVQPQKPHHFLFFAVLVFLIGCGFLIFFFFYHIFTVTNHITRASDNTLSPIATMGSLIAKPDLHALKGFNNGRINILLLGIAGTDKPGRNLTDTIIIASINTLTHKVALLSLPRDLLVKHNGRYRKINSLYQNDSSTGTAEDISAMITEITDQKIHYYLVMDFAGFTQVIDTLGGINITVSRTIHDTQYPGPGYSYETFDISEGFHNIDGATALKYARSRHDDPQSDFGRAQRQQQIMQSVRNKALSIGTLLNPFKMTALLETLDTHISTNIAPAEIRAFLTLIQKIDTQNISTSVVDAWQNGSLLHSTRRDALHGLTPRTGSWDEITELSYNIFDLTQIEAVRKAILLEKPRAQLINASARPIIQKHVRKILTEFGFTVTTTRITSTPTAKTLIIDQSNGTKIHTLDRLIKILDAQVVTDLPKKYSNLAGNTTSTDFVILLGQDTYNRYLYEDVSQEVVQQKD